MTRSVYITFKRMRRASAGVLGEAVSPDIDNPPAPCPLWVIARVDTTRAKTLDGTLLWEQSILTAIFDALVQELM